MGGDQCISVGGNQGARLFTARGLSKKSPGECLVFGTYPVDFEGVFGDQRRAIIR